MSRTFIILYYPGLGELLSFKLRKTDKLYIIKKRMEEPERDFLLNKYEKEQGVNIILKRDALLFPSGIYDFTNPKNYKQNKQIDLVMKYISENKIKNILVYQKATKLKEKLSYMEKRVFLFDYFLEEFFNYQYYNLATYLRQENRAYNIYEEMRGFVKEIEKELEKKEKKRVSILYMVSSKGRFYVPRNHRIQRDIEKLQSEDMRLMIGMTCFFQYETIDMIKEHNPDYIFYSLMEDKKIYKKEVEKKFNKLNVNLRRRIYEIPYGITSWDHNGLESKLLFLFMAKIIYGKDLERFCLKSKMKEFYQRVYRLELKDQEMEQILKKDSNKDNINYDYILK